MTNPAKCGILKLLMESMGGMLVAQPEMQITEYQERQLWGLWCRCTPATAAHSAQALAGYYGKASPKEGGQPSFPFYILSIGSGEKGVEYDLFAGGTRPGEELGEYRLPGGLYAQMAVSPRWGIGAFWNSTLEDKRRRMLEELAARGYRFLGLEYQLHTEESLRRPPVVQLVMAVEAVEKESEEP